MKKNKKMIIISGIGVVILISVFLSYQYFRPPSDVADLKPEIAANALMIANDYSQDEAGSDTKYLGKVVDISGTVANVETQGTEGKTIYYKANHDNVSVAVLMSRETPEDEYPAKDDSVLIRAFCTGFLMDVTFNRGVLIKKY